MIYFVKKTACTALAAMLALTLFGCGKKNGPVVPTVDPTEQITLPTAPAKEETIPETNPAELIEHLSKVMVAGELYTLDHYPNLKSVDLSGSTCYDAIVDFAAKRPQLDVTYTVSVGATSLFNKDTSATLQPDSFDFDTLLENLQYLPNLVSLSLEDIQLDMTQVNAIADAYPNLELEYTVHLFGNDLPSGTTELDLSYMDSSRVSEAIPKLGLLTKLESVTLSNSLRLSSI